MSWVLTNKVVVITGGAEGIGFEIADTYLEQGAKIIIILDINKTLGAQSAEKLKTKHGDNKAVFYECDVTNDIEVISARIFNNYTVDILVNSAGISNEAVPKKTIDINVTALIEFSCKFWEHMRKDKSGNGGTIINLSSIYGLRIDHIAPIYQASKFAVMGFTKSLGHVVHFERSGVRVVAICPGFTETKFVQKSVHRQPSQDIENLCKTVVWQKVDAVGNAAVEVYHRAKSGTAWLIEGAKGIVEV